MIVADADVQVTQARTSLIQARAAVHTTKLTDVAALTDEAVAKADEARSFADAKLQESASRRQDPKLAATTRLARVEREPSGGPWSKAWSAAPTRRWLRSPPSPRIDNATGCVGWVSAESAGQRRRRRLILLLVLLAAVVILLLFGLWCSTLPEAGCGLDPVRPGPRLSLTRSASTTSACDGRRGGRGMAAGSAPASDPGRPAGHHIDASGDQVASLGPPQPGGGGHLPLYARSAR